MLMTLPSCSPTIYLVVRHTRQPGGWRYGESMAR